MQLPLPHSCNITHICHCPHGVLAGAPTPLPLRCIRAHTKHITHATHYQTINGDSSVTKNIENINGGVLEFDSEVGAAAQLASNCLKLYKLLMTFLTRSSEWEHCTRTWDWWAAHRTDTASAANE